MEKITFVPKDCMAVVIGKQKSTLQRISKDTGASFKVINKEIYISGNLEVKTKAYERIKQIIVS